MSVTLSPRPHVWAAIQHTSLWGRLEAGEHIGLCRESLTDDDRKVRDWFVAEAKALGCDVKIDQMGNIFAVLPGENNTLPPIGMGSHLDSQPAGGRFDGILGVVAALEVLRTIKAVGIKTYAPLAAIDWTNEEGSRFPRMCTGSGVWCGAEELAAGHSLADLTNLTVNMGSELKRIGYLGSTPCSYRENPLSAHFELHIEQGPRLEKTNRKLAVVQGVQGMRWYEIRCKGREAHAGATPMSQRADALTALATFVLKTEELARREDAFGTVGMLRVDTNSTNTVPGSGFCTLDLRHSSELVLDTIESELRTHLNQLGEDRPGIRTSMERTWHKKSVRFDQRARQCAREASIRTVGSESLVSDLESYAGHDSAETATVTPTAMIFVPSQGGVSHNPSEFTTEEDCDNGAEALLNAVLLYDDHLRRKANQNEVKSREVSVSAQLVITLAQFSAAIKTASTAGPVLLAIEDSMRPANWE
ncbi:amidase [Thozetella sp. PMI_491]|nr:amidase [Thozetella sp. PMI_491]